MITTLQLVSILSIFIPIGIGLISIGTAGREFRLFQLFLLAGLTTECVMFLLLYMHKKEYLLPIFKLYSLIEALFFYWFALQYIPQSWKILTKRILFICTPLFWIVVVMKFLNVVSIDEGLSIQIFDTIYEVVAAALSGWGLLRMVEEKRNALEVPHFWILLGIFFYCFCTFFIMSFLYTKISVKIWFMNNVVNIVSYIFYSIGLWLLPKFMLLSKKKLQPHSD